MKFFDDELNGTKEWQEWRKKKDLLLIDEHLHSLLISSTKDTCHGASSSPCCIGKIHGWDFTLSGVLKVNEPSLHHKFHNEFITHGNQNTPEHIWIHIEI